MCVEFVSYWLVIVRSHKATRGILHCSGAITACLNVCLCVVLYFMLQSEVQQTVLKFSMTNALLKAPCPPPPQHIHFKLLLLTHKANTTRPHPTSLTCCTLTPRPAAPVTKTTQHKTWVAVPSPPLPPPSGTHPEPTSVTVRTCHHSNHYLNHIYSGLLFMFLNYH